MDNKNSVENTVVICPNGRMENAKCVRVTCRGVMVEGDKILMSHEHNINRWTFPGGGREENETDKQACAREILEETGRIAEIGDHILSIEDHFGDIYAIHKYFLCRITGESELALTDREIEHGSLPEWIEIDKLLEIMEPSLHTDEKSDKNHRVYMREHTALSEYIKKYR